MILLSPLWPLGTEHPVVPPTPSAKETREIIKKKKPIPYPKPVNKIGSLSPRKRLQGEAISAESFASRHKTPFQGSTPTPRCSLLIHFSGLSSWDIFLFKQKVQSAFLLNARAWDRKRVPRQDRVGSPSPPLLGVRPQDGMHWTRSGPSSSSEVSEELGDSSESASVAPTPGSLQRR